MFIFTSISEQKNEAFAKQINILLIQIYLMQRSNAIKITEKLFHVKCFFFCEIWHKRFASMYSLQQIVHGLVGFERSVLLPHKATSIES